MKKYVDFDELIGKVFTKIDVDEDQIKFFVSDSEFYLMMHSQDCCEVVTIESIDGELPALCGNPIISAEVVENENDTVDGIACWTFYKIRTEQEYVTIRWYGESNGYYSVGVSIYLIIGQVEE